MITYLAIGFVVLLLSAVLYGFGIVMRRPPSDIELQTETCSLCRKKFPKASLVERLVGDSRLYYFCSDCITGLFKDSETISPHEAAPHKLAEGKGPKSHSA